VKWLMRRFIGGYARQHVLRAGVQIVAIAVGVALGYAVQLINASALSEFSSAVRSATGQADASISGSPEGFDERILQKVIEHPAVELASPQLTMNAAVLGVDARSDNASTPVLTIVGLDALRAAALRRGWRRCPSAAIRDSRCSTMESFCRRAHCRNSD
jgi:putative ABC transport system permease protein